MRNLGLILFLIFVCPSGPVILFDAGLMFSEWLLHGCGIETISEYVRVHPPWAVAIVAALQVGVIGLAIHFWWPKA